MRIGIRIGDREIFLLTLLRDNRLYGYQIHQMISQHADFFLEADRSAVYNALAKMERHGLISVEIERVENAPDRKLYELTADGQQTLTDNLLNEDLAGRLNILGSLNLLTNLPHLPSSRLGHFLTCRLESLECTAETLAGEPGHAESLSLAAYLQSKLAAEIELTKKMLEYSEIKHGT